jgi:phosphoglycerate kinase
MARKKSIRDLQVNGHRVLVRVDFNVPLRDGVVSDDTRIRGALPTIRTLIEGGGRVVLASHLGRPKGQITPSMSLRPVAQRLEELLGRPVRFATDCIGIEAEAAADALGNGEVLLLENLRFHAEETANDSGFALALANLAEIYVNDAFGTAHRAHASTQGVTAHLSPCVSGLLMERELNYLLEALEAPRAPFVVVLGGAKISGKIEVLENLVGRADAILVGGGMVFTFLRAQGLTIGDSLIEEDRIATAEHVLRTAKSAGTTLVLPTDFIVADRFAADAATRTVSAAAGIDQGWMGLDIGPASVEHFVAELANANTIVWNGPMGVFEMEAFRNGTLALAEAIAKATDRGATSIVGGGDSVAAVNLARLAPRMTHVSTGGGASLELLEGKTLPGVAALDDA